MTLEALQAAAASNQWLQLLPELLLAGLALLLLVLEITLPKSAQASLGHVSAAGILAVLVATVANLGPGAHAGAELFSGLIRFTAHVQFMRVFFLVVALLVTLLGTVALRRSRLPRTEFFHIVLVVTAAMMLLVQSGNFLMLFVALETVTVGFYILVSYTRTNPLSLEAGLKYLVMGALSSGLLLFGIVLLYGAAGNPTLPGAAADPFNFAQVQAFLAAQPDNFLALAGVSLVLGGVAFKIGAVPFQIWIPDVYQGAPTPVTAFLAVASKAAGVAVLLTLCQTVFLPVQSLVKPVLSVMAVATILFGNLAALTQHNTKRLMGLSGASHAGFLLIGIVASLHEGTRALATAGVYFYLATYLLASMAVFGVMTHCAPADDAAQELDDYGDLARDHPFLGGVLAIGLGSLAGIPPLAGFIGKLLVFIAAFKAGLHGLLAVAIVGVVLSIYYYFGWMKSAFYEPWRLPPMPGEEPVKPPRTPVGLAAGAAMAVLAIATVTLGFYQGPLSDWLGLR